MALILDEETNNLTERIIGCAYRVSNILGSGFLEKVYENALALELKENGILSVQQRQIPVRYKGVVVGDYVADLWVEDRVLVELKSSTGLENVFYAQCLNYLRATGLKICLLMNFGKPGLEVKRVPAHSSWGVR